MKERTGLDPDPYGSYILAGRDMIRDFTERCRECGQAPFVSFRLNDCHFQETAGTSNPRRSFGIALLCRTAGMPDRCRHELGRLGAELAHPRSAGLQVLIYPRDLSVMIRRRGSRSSVRHDPLTFQSDDAPPAPAEPLLNAARACPPIPRRGIRRSGSPVVDFGVSEAGPAWVRKIPN